MQSLCPSCQVEIKDQRLKPAAPYDKPIIKFLGISLYKKAKVGFCPNCQARLVPNITDTDRILFKLSYLNLPLIILITLDFFYIHNAWFAGALFAISASNYAYLRYKITRPEFKSREQWRLESEL